MNKVHLIGYRKLLFARLFISFLSLQLNEFLQSGIMHNLSSVQKITYITAIADKKKIIVFCASGLLRSSYHSAVQTVQTWPYFLLVPKGEEKKS